MHEMPLQESLSSKERIETGGGEAGVRPRREARFSLGVPHATDQRDRVAGKLRGEVDATQDAVQVRSCPTASTEWRQTQRFPIGEQVRKQHPVGKDQSRTRVVQQSTVPGETAADQAG